MVIGIIGAGASGMAAALAASEMENVQVILLERHSRVGRKLQATGNGRCNLTNLGASLQNYHGQTPDFAGYALSHHSAKENLSWFSNLGLLTVAEDSGRVYPYSDQANSVVDVLRFSLNRPNIELVTGFEVEKVRAAAGGFLLDGNGQHLSCDRLIIACGGLAGTKLGGSMSGYKLLRQLGHSCTRLRPALVQIRSDWEALPSLKGVRANCRARIFRDGMLHSHGQGEIQFTEHGISGPVIFEISRDVCFEKGNWICTLDLLPDLDAPLLPMLQKRRETALPAEELLTGILHNRLGRIIVKAAGISLHAPIRQLEDWELKKVCDLVRCLPIPLTEPMGMDSAQVTAGGIVTEEFDSMTLESRLVPGLYACGEVLDIDGDCGGYNLQWAWSSGRLAGESAGRLE